MIVDLGEEPVNKIGKFRVVASIYSEKINSYIYSKTLGRFNNYDDAYECWDSTDLEESLVNDIMKKQRDAGDFSHHELEIGIFSPIEYNLAFMNKSLDVENEQ